MNMIRRCENFMRSIFKQNKKEVKECFDKLMSRCQDDGQ